MKKLALYTTMLTAALYFVSCASNVKKINVDLKNYRSRTIPNIGDVNYLEFTAEGDTTKYIILFLGSKKERKGIIKKIKGKSLSIDKSVLERGKILSLEQMIKLIPDSDL